MYNSEQVKRSHVLRAAFLTPHQQEFHPGLAFLPGTQEPGQCGPGPSLQT
jgi:hypothetical protein